jgi:uncharacterized protein
VAKPTKFDVVLESGGSVTAMTYAAKRREGALVLGHGAGAGQTHAFMVGMASGLAERGVETTTFNFPYTQAGRRVPDPVAKLEGCFRDVLAALCAKSPRARFVLGGKSMGGRIASYLAAAPKKEAPIAGVVFLGYPLHPPGKPEQLRAAHLPSIEVPALFVQGTRDPFGSPDELAPVLRAMKSAVLFPIELGGHSFEVPKSAGRSKEEVLASVMDRVAEFVRE